MEQHMWATCDRTNKFGNLSIFVLYTGLVIFTEKLQAPQLQFRNFLKLLC